MLSRLEELKPLIGNTPLRRLELPEAMVFAKLEGFNLSKSIKDRAAYAMLHAAISSGELTQDSVVIESSSGNLAIALATMCKHLGLRFVPVIDPNINTLTQHMLERLCDDVVIVDQPDARGGFLLSRIDKVKALCREIPHAYWTNQYNNLANANGYYQTLGEELCSELEDPDYAFIAVSSCGTLFGLSCRLKECFPAIEIVAVDIEGSLIFSATPGKRLVAGIGAGMRSPLLDHAQYDHTLQVTHAEIVAGCRMLTDQYEIFAGGSSGANLAAIQRFFTAHGVARKRNVVTLFADTGEPYMDTIYNDAWCKGNL